MQQQSLENTDVFGEQRSYALSVFSLGTTMIRYRLTGIVAKLQIKTSDGSVYQPVIVETPTKIRPIIPVISNNLPAFSVPRP